VAAKAVAAAATAAAALAAKYEVLNEVPPSLDRRRRRQMSPLPWMQALDDFERPS